MFVKVQADGSETPMEWPSVKIFLVTNFLLKYNKIVSTDRVQISNQAPQVFPTFGVERWPEEAALGFIEGTVYGLFDRLVAGWDPLYVSVRELCQIEEAFVDFFWQYATWFEKEDPEWTRWYVKFNSLLTKNHRRWYDYRSCYEECDAGIDPRDGLRVIFRAEEYIPYMRYEEPRLIALETQEQANEETTQTPTME